MLAVVLTPLDSYCSGEIGLVSKKKWLLNALLLVNVHDKEKVEGRPQAGALALMIAAPEPANLSFSFATDIIGSRQRA